MQVPIAVPRGEHCKPDFLNQLPEVGSALDWVSDGVLRIGHGEYFQSKWWRQRLTSARYEDLPFG